MNNQVETIIWILLKPLVSHDHLFRNPESWKQKMLIWSKYKMVIYLFVTSQGLHTCNHCFTLGTLFTSSLEAKSCGYQRKHDQWQNVDNTLPRFHTSYIVCDAKTADKETIFNGCCLQLLPAFLQRGSTQSLITIAHRTISNFGGV